MTDQTEDERNAALDREILEQEGQPTLDAEVVEGPQLDVPQGEGPGDGESGAGGEDQAEKSSGELIADPDESKPPATDLVVPGGQAPQDMRSDVVLAFDRADEEQILDELQGRMLEKYLYDYSDGGRRFTDLSYAGVSEAVRTANRQGAGIRIDISSPPLVDDNEKDEEGNDFYRVMVCAIDGHGGARWGTAVEPKIMTKRNGEKKWDKFALTKAMNKAQRNALRALLPVPVIEAMKAKYLKQDDRVKKIARGLAGDNQISQLPPPLTDEASEELRADIDRVRAEIYEVPGGRQKLPPALYQSYLAQNNHSHEGLERYLVWLRTVLEEARAEADEGVKAETVDDKKAREAQEKKEADERKAAKS